MKSTGHGFRSMASTLLNEQGWNRDAIEEQLAHGERDATRAAYNYAEHLPERRRMMQGLVGLLGQAQGRGEPRKGGVTSSTLGVFKGAEIWRIGCARVVSAFTPSPEIA